MPIGVAQLALGLVCAVAGLASIFAVRFVDQPIAWTLASLGIGGLAAWPFIALAIWIGDSRLRRRTAALPESIVVEPGPNGPVAFVRTRGGDVTTFPLPPGYDPSTDNGRWIVEHVLPPELRAEISGEADRA
jgi:hypothetical protein